MSHLFVSYSREDTSKVRDVVHALESAGIAVWMDREDICGGEPWRQRIVEAIRGAAAVLVALSPRSVTSDAVRKELAIAETAGKRILPVVIERSSVPDALLWYVIEEHRIDLAGAPVEGMREVIEAARAAVRTPRPILSPDDRHRIRDVITDATIPAARRVERVGGLLQQSGDELFRTILRLDERARERMERRDRLHREGGSALEKHMLEREAEDDRREREQIAARMEAANRVREQILAQLRAAYGGPALPPVAAPDDKRRQP